MVLVCSIGVAGGLVIFNAGNIQSDITISDTVAPTYNVQIDGTQCPCIITDTLTMEPDSTQQVQHNIKNNENFPVNVEITDVVTSLGLTINLYDGTMTTTTLITVPANDNKWLIVEYVTDGTVTDGDTLTSDIEIKVTPS